MAPSRSTPPSVANQRDEDVPSAVTGGTGAYEGTRGSISQRNLSHGRMQNTVHLAP